jgi:hypothetical protein
MDCPTIPSARTKRRWRVLLYGGVASLLLAVLLLWTVALVQPRLRDGDGEIPNPIRVVWEWFFPPPEFVILGIDTDAVIIVDDVAPQAIEPIPEPPAPEQAGDARS